MKKLFTSLVLLMIGVVATYAENYDLYVAGTQVTSSNASNIMTGISYDAGSKTLTLKNCTFNAGSNVAINNTGIEGLTIKIVGTCSVTSSNDVFVFKKRTVVNGGYHVDATLKAETTGETAAVFWAQSGIDMKIYNLYLTAIGKQYCIYGYAYSTEAKYANLTMSCVEMTATVSTGNNGALAGFSSASFFNDAYLVDGAYNTTKRAVCASSSSTTPLNTVKTRGGLYVGGIIVRLEGSSTDELSPSGKTAGTIGFNNGTKTLTLDGVTYSSSKRFMDNYKVDDLKVIVKGTNTLSTGSTFCIRSNRSFSVEGSSSTYSSNKLTVSNSFSAIYQNDYNNEGMTLLLKNLTLDLKAQSDGAIGGSTNGATDLTINNCMITANYTGSSTVSAISGFKSCTLTGCYVNTAETPAFFNSSKQRFTDINGELAKKVVIGMPSKTYNVYVCGMRVNNLNQTNILVDGLTAGKMRYVDNTDYGYFELNKVTLTSNKSEAISFNDFSKRITIRCDGGTSTINQSNNEAIYGLRCPKIRLEGDNKLVVNVSTSHSAIRLFRTNLEVDLKGLDITSAGRGINAVDGSEEVNLARRSASTVYNINGAGGSLSYKTLTLVGLDFDANATPGCYAGAKYVCQNGGAEVKKNVRFSVPTTTYDLTVAGTPVNNCNMKGIGSQYITAGGGTAAVFDGSKLTLNDATIDCGNNMVNPIRNTGVSGLTVELKGNNVFKDSGTGYNSNNCAFYTEVNTMVTGSGSLDATANKPIMVAGGTFTFKDAKDVKIYSMQAQNTTCGAKLVVNNSNVMSNGRVSFFDDVTWPNGKLLTPADGYYDTTQKRIVNGSGVIAEKVVFGDKNSTGIEGIEVDTDAEVIGIYDVQGRKLDEMQPGINIIRMSNGTTRKVVK